MLLADVQLSSRPVLLPCLLLLQRTVTAMAKVGIPPEQRDAVFATVAAVLHLGNVSFVEGKESDSSMVAPGAAQEHLQAAGEVGRPQQRLQLVFTLLALRSCRQSLVHAPKGSRGAAHSLKKAMAIM